MNGHRFEKGSRNPKWTGRRTFNHKGYVRLFTREHRNKFEHRVVMESSFFRALTGDDTAVVVDGHIFAVWIGQRITLDEAKMNEVTYRRIEGDIRSLAPIAHVSPSCFQAVTWFSWRHRHRISKGWVDRQNQGWFGF